MRSGSQLPTITVELLEDGSELEWKPEAGRTNLVVCCSLWHPKARELLQSAIQRSEEDGLALAVLSTDWSIDAARKHAGELDAGADVLYAGPGNQKVENAWGVEGPAQAILVAGDGRVIDVPSAGELP